MTDPWYRTTLRWGQTNLVEIDPARYDDAWWRAYWRKTQTQGVIVNAGGIVAYYPSEHPLHHRAVTLGERDLYGDIVRSAREEGIKVIARMDSNRVAEDFYREHADWICVDADGKPYRVADKYITCVNSAYYDEYLPGVMSEIIHRSTPDGFADNSWAGLPRDKICYCANCRKQFTASSGLPLPRRADWHDESYRRWIRWNYDRRTEIWELNNRVTKAAGGDDCVWMGMVSGDMLNNSARFIDIRQILRRADIVMLDHQHRHPHDSFEQNSEVGKRLHELAGWEKLIPESTPMYQLGHPAFRLAAMPEAEARLWSSHGFAGGIQPWWHHIGSAHDDRRQYETAGPIFNWHAKNEKYLTHRVPQAAVGVVWSQSNNDFYGRAEPVERSYQPYRGVVKTLTEAAIPFVPVHVDDLSDAAGRFRVLVLPNVAAMSESTRESLRAFSRDGGAIIATGETSLYDEMGDRLDDYGLADLFGVHATNEVHGSMSAADVNIERPIRHTYLRLEPSSFGADPTDIRHAALDGFELTDSIPFGGYLPVVTTDSDVTVPLTFIPDFPIYPPETAWMRVPSTRQPGLVIRETQEGNKVALVVADLDRCAARDEQPDHYRLIANLVRWAVGANAPLTVVGETHVSCNIYAQDDRQIVHFGNTLVTSPVPGRQEKLIPTGPFRTTLPRRAGAAPDTVALLVSGATIPTVVDDETISFEIERVLDHEVAVIEWAASA